MSISTCDLRPAAAAFLSRRGGGNWWAANAENVRRLRTSDRLGVLPITLELSPVLSCNADCPLCPFRRSRLKVRDRRVAAGSFSAANGNTTATDETLEVILARSAEAGVTGVIWTGGGEPTLLSSLPRMCRHAARTWGMDNALYSNGFLLGAVPELAEELLAPEAGMVFIRISINSATDGPTRKHWGVSDPEEVYRQWLGLERLLVVRERLRGAYEAAGRAAPSIQVSTVIDRHNVTDLELICRRVGEVFARHPGLRGDEDIMVVRPLVDHRRAEYALDDHDAAVVEQVLRVSGRGGIGRKHLEGAQVPLFLGFGLDLLDDGAFATYADVIREQYDARTPSRAHGLFLTVDSTAQVYPCTEMNCQSEWAIGNLLDESVEEIYRGHRRRAILEAADACRWGPTMFQPFPRFARLDRIAQALVAGTLTDADVVAIERHARSSHRLLLN